MAKKKEEPKKPKPSKLEEKLAIDGTFQDVFKVIRKHKEQNIEKAKTVALVGVRANEPKQHKLTCRIKLPIV
jgi:hypothetical protein